MNVPNAICVARVFLCLIAIGILWLPSDTIYWTSFVMTIIVIWADGLDGYFARKLNQATKFGAMFDIVCDRAVELCYLFSFAILNWIPAWIPFLFLIRGTFVDAIRAQASEKGFTAFGASTMMQSKIGKFLVISNFVRFIYAFVKAAAFGLIILAQVSSMKVTYLPQIANALIYVSAILCVVRGLPVLFEAKMLFASDK
jgi:CDP-diacylglycerol--glycerol-3-phosphate 3-phosphatidyltransferase